MKGKLLSTLAAAMMAVGIGASQPACTPVHARIVNAIELRDTDIRRALDEIVDSVHCVRTSSEYVLDVPPGYEGAPPTKTQTGHGTAFAYMRRGGYTYLVTNVHVIEEPEHMEEAELVPDGHGGIDLVISSYTKTGDTTWLVENGEDEDASDDILVEVVARNEALDISIIRTTKNIPVADSYQLDRTLRPEAGQDVFVVGYPRGRYEAVTVGSVANPGHVDSDDNEILDILDVNSTFGNSGSPYFVRRGDTLYWAGTMGKISTYPRSLSTMFTLGTPIREFQEMLDDPEAYALSHAKTR